MFHMGLMLRLLFNAGPRDPPLLTPPNSETRSDSSPASDNASNSAALLAAAVLARNPVRIIGAAYSHPRRDLLQAVPDGARWYLEPAFIPKLQLYPPLQCFTSVGGCEARAAILGRNWSIGAN